MKLDQSVVYYQKLYIRTVHVRFNSYLYVSHFCLEIYYYIVFSDIMILIRERKIFYAGIQNFIDHFYQTKKHSQIMTA